LVIKGGQFTSQRKAKTVMRGANVPFKPSKYNNAYGSQAFSNDLTDIFIVPSQ